MGPRPPPGAPAAFRFLLPERRLQAPERSCDPRGLAPLQGGAGGVWECLPELSLDGGYLANLKPAHNPEYTVKGQGVGGREQRNAACRGLSGRGTGRPCDPSPHRGDLVPACKELSRWGPGRKRAHTQVPPASRLGPGPLGGEAEAGLGTGRGPFQPELWAAAGQRGRPGRVLASSEGPGAGGWRAGSPLQSPCCPEHTPSVPSVSQRGACPWQRGQGQGLGVHGQPSLGHVRGPWRCH